MKCGYILFLAMVGASAQQKSKTTPPNQVILEAKCESCVKIKPSALADGRMLVTVGDSVYMLDPDGKQLWKHTVGLPISSPPAFHLRLNEVAIVAPDLYFVRLDAATGKLKWTADVVGRAGFDEVVPFGEGYLVVVNMEGYRQNLKGLPVSPTLDTLDYWGPRQEDYWQVPFPRNAHLLVNGQKIYAVTSRPEKIVLREVLVPTKRR